MTERREYRILGVRVSAITIEEWLQVVREGVEGRSRRVLVSQNMHSAYLAPRQPVVAKVQALADGRAPGKAEHGQGPAVRGDVRVCLSEQAGRGWNGAAHRCFRSERRSRRINFTIMSPVPRGVTTARSLR